MCVIYIYLCCIHNVCFIYVYIYTVYTYRYYSSWRPWTCGIPHQNRVVFWGRWNHGCRLYVDIPRSPFKKPGWWCNNHLEKYEFVNGKDDIPYMKWKITHVWNHQPETCSLSYFFSQFAMEIHHQNALVIRNMVCWTGKSHIDDFPSYKPPLLLRGVPAGISSYIPISNQSNNIPSPRHAYMPIVIG